LAGVHCAYRLDIHACKRPDQVREIFCFVVDAVEQDRLISHYHAVLEETIRSLACDPGNFTDVIEVRVEAHLFRHLPAFVRQFDQRVGPRVFVI
jgi:hypothetical protein